MHPDEAEPESSEPLRAQLDPVHSESLMRMLLGALLYRLGGEESFTEQALDDIMNTVGGVQVIYIPDAGDATGRYILRVRDPQRAAEIAERGLTI